MIGRKKLGEKYVTLAEVQEILRKAWEEGVKVNPEEPLNYEARLSLEHAERFSKVKPEDVEKAREELIATFDWMTERLAVKLLDLMPEDYFDIRVIFAKEDYMPSPEEGEAIVGILSKYRKE
ncbi:RNA polymerase Rpb4 family protein [Palaeococcus ferrophilus]|uniref:RNA polymerase Rpb4 family protein n=1 Tax=Palaeococcus ferrophilus TaxID=83868 RepID=UPI00064F3C97|nr:RNA polymerase Rpb4 family protein [Palaeococcus ferrophilus]